MICPEKAQLEGYLLGTLDPDGNAIVDEHLDSCTACLSALETLDPTMHSVTAGLRRAALLQPQTEDPAFESLVEKVKALGGQPPPVDPPIAAGLVLGSYAVGEPIAAGGMGQVYKAEHRLMKRLVALKVLPPELFGAPRARARFRREVEAAARLRSPHIVAAYDAGESGGRDYLVMEYVEGRTLEARVKTDGPFDIRPALECILQTARGLEHAHAAGIVHRDIKPANLILTDAPQPALVKILDMGLARIEEPTEEGHLTSAHVVMGTAAYMAPEQAADTRQADERADIYSVGCTLFFLLTGRPPYEADTAMGTLLAHREQPIPSLRAARPDCPPAVEALFRRLVAKDPAQRPASATVVRAELERVLAALGEPGTPARPWRSWLVAGALGLAASVLLGFAIVAMRGAPPPPPQDGQQASNAARPVEASAPAAPLIDMVYVKPGEFWIGATDTDSNAGQEEKPRRRITITQGFFLGKTEVTQAQYRTVMGANPSAFSAAGKFRRKLKSTATDSYPVDSVSWSDAIHFCNQLSERERLPPYYRVKGDTVTVRGGNGYRLPTEAEWEYAGRAGATTIWSFGDDPAELPRHAWFAANSQDTTHPVGLKKPNAFGLFDMYGNVPEWCWDYYDPTYYDRMPESDPPGSGKISTRVYRGGGWNVAAAQTRASARESLGPSYSVLTIVGMRVARNAAQ
jgi:serine/threonine protein kinase